MLGVTALRHGEERGVVSSGLNATFRKTVIRAFTWLFSLCAALSAVTSQAAGLSPAGPQSVAFWYAPHPPYSELAQFDWSVLEPSHVQAKDVAFLRAQGNQPFAYLSIGEFDGDLAVVTGSASNSGASAVQNKAWGSQVMHLSSPEWRAYLLRRAGELREAGYAGLFLDTLDSFQLLPAAEHETQRAALRDFLSELKRQEPDLKLFFNRGFEVLPELPGVAAAVAVESIHAGWDAQRRTYRVVPQADRDWLDGHLQPLRDKGIPLVAIEYLPPDRRNEAPALVARLVSEGFVPYVTVPNLDYLGVSTIDVQPRRIAMIFDPREGTLYQNPGHMYVGGLLEYLGYRVDYFEADHLPNRPMSGLYAGVVVWMTSGPPENALVFNQWLSARADEHVPLALLAGLPVENDSVLRRFGLRLTSTPLTGPAEVARQDDALIGHFEAPVVVRTRDLPSLTTLDGGPTPVLGLRDSQQRIFTPVAIGDWGGIALSPYVVEEGADQRRWIIDPFAFLQKALRLPAMPRPDTTTENGRRVATVHIDGDGFVSRAEAVGTPYSGDLVLRDFIKPYPFLTSVSVIEGEVGPRGAFPHLARELEPIARKIFAEPKVEVATHTFSHPFFWQPEVAEKREGFNPEYGYMMKIPGYDKLDFNREIAGSTAYINQNLTTPQKPVKMVFWSGDAMPDEATIKLAYDNGLTNVNGGNTALTNAYPSLTGLYPLIRPTSGGIHYYAPVINENVYTNLWTGPYYGFRGVMETFALTDKPRRLRGLHLYYHFYSGTKQASIRVMNDIYKSMAAEHPISLWMSDYVPRMHGLYQVSLARRADGAWQIRGLDGLRTVRLDAAMGWPDLSRSSGVAGVRDLPQGRYVHLASEQAVLALRDTRDPRPALEEANLPLLAWTYLDDHRVTLSFAGNMPLQFSVRAQGTCRLEVAGKSYSGTRQQDLWRFSLPMERVLDAQLTCR